MASSNTTTTTTAAVAAAATTTTPPMFPHGNSTSYAYVHIFIEIQMEGGANPESWRKGWEIDYEGVDLMERIEEEEEDEWGLKWLFWEG
jgi:hypothetical protein